VKCVTLQRRSLRVRAGRPDTSLFEKTSQKLLSTSTGFTSLKLTAVGPNPLRFRVCRKNKHTHTRTHRARRGGGARAVCATHQLCHVTDRFAQNEAKHRSSAASVHRRHGKRVMDFLIV